MRTYVRIVIPGKASLMVDLGEKVVAKHQADGVASILGNINMTEMQALLNIAKEQDALAFKLRLEMKNATEQRNLALGIVPGSPSVYDFTVLYYITSIRDFLKGQLRGEEQKLGDWGYEVNTNSKGDVRVVIPYRKALGLIRLGKKIVARHNADGASSLLNQFDMAGMAARLTKAEQQYELSQELSKKKEIAIQNRNNALGTGRKKDSSKKGTLRFYLISVRDTLFGKFREDNRTIGLWGFEVNSSKPPKNKED